MHQHLLVRPFAPVSNLLETVLGLRSHICVVTAHVQIEAM